MLARAADDGFYMIGLDYILELEQALEAEREDNARLRRLLALVIAGSLPPALIRDTAAQSSGFPLDGALSLSDRTGQG